jgi:hypothetical protein
MTKAERAATKAAEFELSRAERVAWMLSHPNERYEQQDHITLAEWLRSRETEAVV